MNQVWQFTHGSAQGSGISALASFATTDMTITPNKIDNTKALVSLRIVFIATYLFHEVFMINKTVNVISPNNCKSDGPKVDKSLHYYDKSRGGMSSEKFQNIAF
jgi:hypothetical protein